MKDYSSETKVNDINKKIRDITVTIKFNADILLDSKRGNFNVEIISEENEDTKATGTATLNDDGTITWNVTGINASETATFQYK